MRIRVVVEYVEPSGINVEEIRRQQELLDQKARVPAPVLSVSQIDNHGIFSMSFDQIVIYPSYLNNYKSPEIQVRYL